MNRDESLFIPSVKYVYMMAAAHKGKKDVVLGRASKPHLRIRQHNRELKGGPPATRTRAPHWKLNMVLGPFITGSQAARKEWRRRIPRFERAHFSIFSTILRLERKVALTITIRLPGLKRQ